MLSLAFFVLLGVLGVVLGVADGRESGAESFFLVWNSVSQVMIFGLPALIVSARYFRGQQRDFLKLDFCGHRWLLAMAGVAVMLLLVPLTEWLTVWNDSWHWSGVWEAVERELRRVGEESQEVMSRILEKESLPMNLLCVALIPALCEELFFRAGIQNLMQRWFKSPHAAVWVTAAVFSLAHGELFAFLPRFLLGVLLGYLYVGGKSLVVNIVAHFVNNAMVVLFFWMAPSLSGIDPAAPLGFGWAITLVCSVAAVILFAVTFGKGLKISN